MIMIKREILELNLMLNKLKDLGNTKFKYFVIKNLSLLKNHVTPLSEIETEDRKVLADFEKDRNELIIRIGKPKDNGYAYIDVNDTEMFNLYIEEVKKLTDKHKDSLNKYEELAKQFNVILDEEVEEVLNLRNISIDECPDNGLETPVMEVLLKHNLIV